MLHIFPLLALAGLALANNHTYSFSSHTHHTHHTHHPHPTQKPHHHVTPGKPKYLGCYGSTAGFKGFSLVGSSREMTVSLCAASCPSEYLGLYNTDCYCGDKIESHKNQMVGGGQCNTRCPGDRGESCGGISDSLRLAHEKGVPLDVLLSVYKNEDDRPNRPTFTATVTSTHTSTITTCHPGRPCHYIPTTQVTTITSTWCPEPTKDPGHHHEHSAWDEKTIVCHGGNCPVPPPPSPAPFPELPCGGPECRKQCEGPHCSVLPLPGQAIPGSSDPGSYHGSSPEGSSSEGSPYGSSSEGSPYGSSPEGSSQEGSSRYGSSPDGSSSEGRPQDSSTEGSSADGSSPGSSSPGSPQGPGSKANDQKSQEEGEAGEDPPNPSESKPPVAGSAKVLSAMGAGAAVAVLAFLL